MRVRSAAALSFRAALHGAEWPAFAGGAATFAETQGQPWLTNALARQLTEVLVPDPRRAIQASDVVQARQHLISRMDTHLDSLAERLREARVRRILAPMIAGETLPDLSADDLRYVTDLGLCRVIRRSPRS